MTRFLPEEMIESTISDIVVGERAFTVPWAMQVNLDNSLWISGDYMFTYSPGGTSHMEIINRGDHIEVKKDSIRNNKFSPMDLSPYFQEWNLLPVELK